MNQATSVLIEVIAKIIEPGKKKPLNYLIMGKPTRVITNPNTNEWADKLVYQLNPLYWNNAPENIKQITKEILELAVNNDNIGIHHYENQHRIEIYLKDQ